MPTDDIFDLAWNVAKEEMVSDDEEIFSYWDNDRHEDGRALPDDVEKGFFSDFTSKVKQKQKEQEALNAYIVNNLIRHPDGLEAGARQHRMALEQMNKPKSAIPESMDSVTGSPPIFNEKQKISNDEIQPETVRAEIPRTGFRGGAEGAPTPPSPNNNSELIERWNRFNDTLPKDEAIPFDDFIANIENFPDFDELVTEVTTDRQKLASEPQQTADSWTVVKDPFANPFFNEGFASLTEEQPPEVTHDNTPIISLQPDLIKGESPEEALINAGFDARRGDDMSLLPSSAFNKDGEAPKGDTSLLPAGWDSE